MEPGNQWFVTGSADRTIKVISSLFFYFIYTKRCSDCFYTVFTLQSFFFFSFLHLLRWNSKKKKEPGVFLLQGKDIMRLAFSFRSGTWPVGS